MGKKKEALLLGKTLKESAMRLGMCNEGIAGWLDYKSLDDLCEHYWEGIEFIINHPGWPSNKWLVEKIGKETLHRHGIFIDDAINLENPQKTVLNGECHGTIKASDFSAPAVYLRDNGKLTLDISDAAIAHVNVYNDALLNIHCGRFAQCYVYLYGGSVNSDGDGKVVIRDRTTSQS